MAENTETEKIHDQVTWPESWPVFDDGTGGLAFPEQNNSNCPEGSPVTIGVSPVVSYDGANSGDISIACTPSYSVKIEPGRFYVRLKQFKCIYGGEHSFVTMDECGTLLVNATATPVPNTDDPLVCTTIPDIHMANFNNSHPDDPCFFIYSSFTELTNNSFDWTATDNPETAITFDLAVDLDVNATYYVNLQHQDNLSENGLYCYDQGSVRKIATAPLYEDTGVDDKIDDSTANDNVPCCNHFRKTYSHEEVADYTLNQVGEVTSFGVKSMSPTDCDGGFIDWFTTDGEVNIGNGHVPLFVNGFGLGKVYRGSNNASEVKKSLPRDDYDENDATRHPWMTWAYGTRSDDRTATNLVALPRDWPFHGVSGSEVTKYDSVDDTNNITFVKCGVVGSSTIGNLEYDREDPQGNDEHVFVNRHHVVLYPEFDKLDGKVIVKPTFIHLPASMDTKDGETVELTVSIHNVDQTAFGDGDKASLSGYYAAMAQPRVYVMGGVQKFFNKRMAIDKDSIVQYSEIVDGKTVYTEYDATSPVVATDASGEPLAGGTEVRANIIVSKKNATGDRRKFVAIGYIVSSSSGLGGGTSFKFKRKFPYDINGRGWSDYVFTICGMAYLDDVDNPTETKMGLVGRDDDVMVGDTGDGESGTLNEFNKFFSISNGNDEDTGRTELPHVDKRFLLATVYQSATNTFPWEFVGRHRMSKLDRNWSDEHHRGNKSIVQMIYEQNKRLVDNFYDGTLMTAEQYPNTWPVSYVQPDDWEWKSLGSAVHVELGDTISKAILSFYGNPVRQASRAIQEFANDFNHMRLLSAKGSSKARVKVAGINVARESGEWPSAGDTIVSAGIQPSTTGYDSASWQADLINSAWCANVRSLPDYVLKTDFSTDASTVSTIFENQSLGHDVWEAYLKLLPYNTGTGSDKESSACTDEAPNTVIGSPWDYEVYSCNSACAKITKKRSPEKETLFNDIRRYSETVLAVKVSDELMDLSSLWNDKSKDWANPFTHISSLDGAPVPTISSYPSLQDAQQEFVSFDAVQMYRYEYDDANDTISDVSTVMPTSTALAKFIEKYVAAYGADMYKHVYQGTRIFLKNGNLPASNDEIYIRAIYIRAIDRVQKRNSDAENFVDRYIMDNFANTSSNTRDSNFDRAYVDEPSISMTDPPYAPSKVDAYNGDTYTRVFMQFTFSQKAGRWYTTDYRQYPTNYLTPLYGADAINAGCYSVYNTDGSVFVPTEYKEINVRPLWVNSACSGFNSYRSHVYAPYSLVPPMDISLGCVPYLYGAESTSDALFPFGSDGKLKAEWNTEGSMRTPVMKRLERPYLDLDDGGIGLYPPANATGGHKSETDDGVHANFWSVRKFIRPAVSVLPGTDIPTYTGRDNGVISDPTLFDQFDFPARGEKVYIIPSETDPEDDSAMQILLYRNPGETVDGKMENLTNNKIYYMGYGLSAEAQGLDE